MGTTDWQGIFVRLEPGKRQELRVLASRLGYASVSEYVRELIDRELVKAP